MPGQAMARARARVSALLAPMQRVLLQLLRPVLALLALTLVLVATLLQLMLLATALLVLWIGGFASRATTPSS